MSGDVVCSCGRDLALMCRACDVDQTRAETAESHVEELQAEALGIEDGAPPESTTTAQAILAIRAMRAEVARLRAALRKAADMITNAPMFEGDQWIIDMIDTVLATTSRLPPTDGGGLPT